ncbi:hypothetical protein HDU98_008509 [Podochytrium sp. JEL0797]|nr:hypothetical protein HDU98_008509 [Podochytrium sp. JEL0797]
MASYFGTGGSSMRMAGYTGHEEEENEEGSSPTSRISTEAQPALSPTKPGNLAASPVKAKAPKSATATPKTQVTEKPVAKPAAPTPTPPTPTQKTTPILAPKATPVQNTPAAAPNVSTRASQATAAPQKPPVDRATQVSPQKAEPAPRAEKVAVSTQVGTKSDASREVSPGPTTETAFHGNQTGSLSMSTARTTASREALNYSSGSSGNQPVSSLAMSQHLTDSKEELSYNPNPTANVTTPIVKQISSLSLSQQLTDSKDSLQYSATPDVDAVVSLLRAKRGRFVPDETTIDVLMKAIAAENDWSEEDVQSDVAAFKRYRLKRVKNLRSISTRAWVEMKDLMPITKDLVRKAIGWATEE